MPNVEAWYRRLHVRDVYRQRVTIPFMDLASHDKAGDSQPRRPSSLARGI
jgi:hypothetical protein